MLKYGEKDSILTIVILYKIKIIIENYYKYVNTRDIFNQDNFETRGIIMNILGLR